LSASTDPKQQIKSERFPIGLSIHEWKVADQNDFFAVFLDLSKNKAICEILRPHPEELLLGFAFSGSLLIQNSRLEILKNVALPSSQERLSFNSWIPTDINQRIANLKVQAAMELMNGDPKNPGRTLKIAQRLESSVSEITGRRFSVIAQANPEPKLMFLWGDRTLPIEGLPAGLNSLLAWMFAAATVMDLTYPESKDPLAEEAFFFLDEPEAYLHPEWQRRILPMAQLLFPNSQFFVATHSPFVVSSVNEGFIYKLIPDENGEVTISEAIPASKGDSYITAVSEVLGLSEWYDPESEKLLANFRAERDAALRGNSAAETKARTLAESISIRSAELANVIGMELRQLDRQLDKLTASAKP
jgi:predicted ATP-binding protein involved in virulence